MTATDDSQAAPAQNGIHTSTVTHPIPPSRTEVQEYSAKVQNHHEHKSEEGTERLKALKSELTQRKIDADTYTDSAKTIILYGLHYSTVQRH